MCYSDHNHDLITKGNCDYCGESLRGMSENDFTAFYANAFKEGMNR